MRGRSLCGPYHGDSGDLAYLVTLALEQEAKYAAACAQYVLRSVLSLPKSTRVWCPEPGGLPRDVL